MRIVNSILTKSDCYRTGRKITVRGLTLHSVGTPQPNALVFVRNWNRPGIPKGVHAFVGADGAVYQTLPWNHRAWHIGGAANNTHIGVEMTEPAQIRYTSGSKFTYNAKDYPAIQAHVKATYKTSVELFAYLCKQYKLNPLGSGVIISHREGYKRGVGSNHGDPEHLWNQTGLGYNMDKFRNDVANAMKGGSISVDTGYKYPTTMAEIKVLQSNLSSIGFPPAGGIDGSYGPGTKTAVFNFQKSVGLTVDGSAGPSTQKAIAKAIESQKTASVTYLRQGAKGDSVKVIQEKLKTLGYEIAIDGSFGPGMDRVVRTFQSSVGLPPDGSIGPNTLNKIAEKIVEKKEPIIKTYIARGSVGEYVKEVQENLSSLGYSLTIDGSFGPSMEIQVKKFQKDQGLTVDGIFGPSSKAALAKALEEKNKPKPTPPPVKDYLQRGDTGDDVRQLQEQLRKLGYNIDVDGSFGPMLEREIRVFQTSNGLTVDGVAGKITRAKIEELVNKPKPVEPKPVEPKPVEPKPTPTDNSAQIRQEILERITPLIDEVLKKWL